MLASAGPFSPNATASGVRISLFDTRAAKELAWMTDGYSLVTTRVTGIAPALSDDCSEEDPREVDGASGGGGSSSGRGGGSRARVLVPAVQLLPGRYLVVLELLTAGEQQGLGAEAAGDGQSSALTWQLQLLPSADEKVRL